MEFGTIILSKKKSISNDSVIINRHFLTVLTVTPAMYCMTRPDTGNIIMELNGMLCEEKPENISLFLEEKENCLEYVGSYFTKRLKKEQNAICILEEEELPTVTNKLNSLQVQYEQTKKKNETEYTETREKSMKELEKSIRKYKRKIEAIQYAMNARKEDVKELKMAEEYSLEKAKEVFAEYENQNRKG